MSNTTTTKRADELVPGDRIVRTIGARRIEQTVVTAWGGSGWDTLDVEVELATGKVITSTFHVSTIVEVAS